MSEEQELVDIRERQEQDLSADNRFLEDKEFLEKMREEPLSDVLIRPIREVITVCWVDSPNWLNHSFFSQIIKEAISSKSKNGYRVVDITRKIWDREIPERATDDKQAIQRDSEL